MPFSTPRPGEPLIDDLDAAAHAHLPHCARCQQAVAEARADAETLHTICRSAAVPWRDRLRITWPHWTIRQRVSYVTFVVPQLLLLDLRMRAFQWRHDFAYAIRAVRARRAGHRNILAGLARRPLAAAPERSDDARKAALLATFRRLDEARLLAACQASRRATRPPRPEDGRSK